MVSIAQLIIFGFKPQNSTSPIAQALILNPKGGNVGIGTTAPSGKLHVVGQSIFDGSAGSPSSVKIKTGTGAGALEFIGRSSDNNSGITWYANNGSSGGAYFQSNCTWMRARADGGVHFRQGNTPVVTDTDGFTIQGMNVGIGTAAPAGLLSLANETRTLDVKLKTSPATGDMGVQFRAGSGDYLGLAAGGGTGIGIVIDDSNKVGIGTSAPLTPLHVKGSTGNPSTSANNGVFTLNSSNAVQLQFGSYAATPYGYWLQTKDNNNAGPYNYPLLLQPVNGNVGIGLANPDGRLEIAITPTVAATTVNETDDFADKFVISNAATSNFGDRIPLVFNVGGKGADNISAVIVGEREASGWRSALSFWVNNVTSGSESTDAIQEAMRINSDGNVGIGTTAPADELHVYGSGNIALFESSSVNAWLKLKGSTTYSWQIGTTANGLQFYNDTTSSYRVTFKPDGNVGIGTAVPGAKLDVAGVSRIQSTGPTLRLYDTDHDTHSLQMDLSGGNFRFYKYTGSTDASHSEIFRVTTAGVVRFNNVYSFPSVDGTAGYHLQTDGSGNVTWAAAGSGGGGTVTGTGTANYISKWTGTSSQGNSQIFDNGSVGISTAANLNSKLNVYGATGANLTSLITCMSSDATTNGGAGIFLKASSNTTLNRFGVQIAALRNSNTNGSADLVFSLEKTDASGLAERVRFLGDGKVGIGTNAPTARLTVDSDTVGESISGGLRLQNSNGANNDISPIYFGVHGGTRRAKCGIGWKRTGSYGIGKLLFALDNTGDDADVSFANDTKVTFQGDGNVGIGTTTPGEKLEVVGNIYANVSDGGGVMFPSSNGIVRNSGTGVALRTNSTDRLIVDNNGNVSLPADGASLKLGASADLQMWHGSDGHSYISNTTGAFWIKSTVTDGNIIFAADRGDGGGTFDYFSLDGGSTTYSGGTTAAYTKWQDNSRIALGTGKDLQLYHDGSHSYVSETGTGNLVLGGTQVWLKNSALNENMLGAVEDGAVTLYYNGSAKLATNSTGAAVTGYLKIADVDTGVGWGDLNTGVFGRGTANSGSYLQFRVNGGTAAIHIDSDKNVGIGTAAPATPLHVWSTSYPQFRVSYNSSLYFTLDHAATLNVYGNDWYVRLNSSEKFRIKQDGKVGIGTNNPGYALDIRQAGADIFLSSTTGTNRAGFQSANTGGVSYFYRESSSGGGAFGGTSPYATAVGGTGAYPLQLGTNNAVRLTIDSAGKVGIGTTAPLGKLDIYESSTAVPLNTALRVGAYANAVGEGPFIDFVERWTGSYPNWVVGRIGGIYEQDSPGSNRGALVFYTNESNSAGSGAAGTTEKMRIQGDGRVGIGTVAPDTRLHVWSPSPDFGAGLAIQHDTSYAGRYATLSFGAGSYRKAAIAIASSGDTYGTGDLIFCVDPSNDAAHVASSNERMRITSAGKVGIGTTPDSLFQIANANGSSYRFGYAGTSDIYFDADDVYFRSDTGGVNNMVLKGSKLGIGTTAPDSKLMIQGGNYNSSLKIKGSGPTSGVQFVDSDNNTDGYVYAASGAVGFLDSGTHWMVKCENDSFISFSTNNGTEHMRIKSDGNVGIGTAAPGNLLHLYRSGNDSIPELMVHSVITSTTVDYHKDVYAIVGKADGAHANVE